jgi:hypothetical protein
VKDRSNLVPDGLPSHLGHRTSFHHKAREIVDHLREWSLTTRPTDTNISHTHVLLGVLKEGRESTRGTPFPRFWFLSPPDRVRGEATRAGEPLKASKQESNPVTRLRFESWVTSLVARELLERTRCMCELQDDALTVCSSATHPKRTYRSKQPMTPIGGT